MKGLKTIFKRNLTAKIALSMAGMLLLGLITIAVVFVMVSAQKTDGKVINEAGRLRMLSQKMAKASFMIASGKESARDELMTTAALFDQGFNAVRYGDAEVGIPPASEQVEPQLEKVARFWEAFHASIEVLAGAQQDSMALSDAVAEIGVANLILLEGANEAVKHFELEASVKVNRLLMILAMILALDVLVFFVVLWMVRRAIQPVKALAGAVEGVAEGKWESTVEVRSQDEVGALAQSFNVMVERIRAMTDAMHSEKEKAEAATGRAEEAAQAAQVQEQSLSRSVGHMLSEMGRFAGGDLTVHLDAVHADGDIATLYDGFNQAVQTIDAMLRQVNDLVKLTSNSAGDINTSSEALAAGAQEQSTQAQEVAAAVEEMTQTIIGNARNATHTAEIVEGNGKVAQEGSDVVQQTVTKIKEIAEVVRSSTDTIERLGKSSDQIGEIVEVINDIASQTNLLALNAAIEAARAGEQGRGFAVVADEVSKLADRTSSATRQIADMIETIQVDTHEAVQAMQRGNKEVEEGIVLADRAGVSLDRIVAGVQQVVDVVNQIAAASDEQSTTSENISRSVEAISTVSSEAAMGIAHISRSADQLRRETDALLQLVAQFKMANKADGGAESRSSPPREDRAPEPHAGSLPAPSDRVWT